MIIITEYTLSKTRSENSSHSLKLLKNTKPSNPSIFFNIGSIFEILLALILYHHPLHLFVKFGRKEALIRSCPKCTHQWQNEFPCNRSNINWVQAHHSPSSSSFYICLWRKARKEHRFQHCIPGNQLFRISWFFQCLCVFGRVKDIDHRDAFSFRNG